MNATVTQYTSSVTASHCRVSSPTEVNVHGCTVSSSDWLPCCIKATRPVLEIFKMAGYFPGSPRIGFCF